MAEKNPQNHSVPGETKNCGSEPDQTISGLQFSKRRVIKNLLIICMGLLLLFTAYNGLSMLQSTMNQEQGIGVASQAIIYAGFCISALLLPKYVIKKLGCKRTLLFSTFCYIPYIASNFYFHWVTMIPSVILLGLGSSLLWSSQCTYFNEASGFYSILTLHESREKQKTQQKEFGGEIQRVGRTLTIETLDASMLQIDANGALIVKQEEISSQLNAKVSNKTSYALQDHAAKTKLQNVDFDEYPKLVSSVTARFFGLFGLVYRTSDIWSNLMSFYVLQDQISLDNITDNSNCSCGAAFCNVEQSSCFEHNLAEPNQQKRNILTGASVTLAILGVILIFLFLDELESEKQPVQFSFSFAMATCKFVQARDAVFLLPLSAYIGLQQAFYIGDFTKSYIACAWGVYHVGLVTTCYGMAAGISCTVAGFLVKHIGRMSVMLLGATVNAGTCVYLLQWTPLPDQPAKFFIMAACWGISIGVFWSQLRAYYGVIFKEDQEAAYAGFYLWDSIGYCVAFSYSNYICTYLKIYVLLGVSTLGVIGYLATEIRHKHKSKGPKPH